MFFVDDSVMMLEADILMGNHGQFQDMQPIMAHPPAQLSDLTFTQFLDGVLRATKIEGKRKGIKLDFKDIEAVEPCLKQLKLRVEELGSPSFPIFVNADILEGPVNATKKPLNPERFISLVKENAPFAVLSIGWTTRFGTDDPADEIREGKYTKLQMKEMLKVLRAHGGNPPVFPHVTFPVRAGLAAESIEELLYLTARVTDSSITLWSPKTDPVNRKALQMLVHQLTNRHVFIDLPFSIEDDDSMDDNHVQEGHPQQLEGRGHSEGESVMTSGAVSYTSFFSMPPYVPLIAFGVITTVLIAFRRL